MSVQGFENRHEVRIKKDDAILGVVNDEGDLIREESDVYGVEYCAHAWHSEIQLQVPIVIPPECGYAVTGFNAKPFESVRERAGTFGHLGVGIAVYPRVGSGDDGLIGRELAGSV